MGNLLIKWNSETSVSQGSSYATDVFYLVVAVYASIAFS